MGVRGKAVVGVRGEGMVRVRIRARKLKEDEARRGG